MTRRVEAGRWASQVGEVPAIGCDLPIEHPGVIVHNELVLSGWAASAHGISGVVVQIDDRLLHAAYGLETPWVAEAMPGVPGAGHAGYSLRLDTSGWEPGTRKVTIAAFDGEGRRGEIAGEVRVQPFTEPLYTREENLAAIAEGGIAMWLEEPRTIEGDVEVESPVEVSGWAYAEGGLEAVIVTVDGRRSYEALRPIVRPDLLEGYGEVVAGAAGFVLRLHPSELPPGDHTLTVVAVRPDGAAVGVEGSVVCLPEREGIPMPEPGEAVAVDWLEDRARPRERDEQPERYDPERHAGLLLEAEHRLRYRWARQIVKGRIVLDASPGVEWGATVLAEGGAERVVALEVDDGELDALPYEDASFDLVTCFHALQRVNDPKAVLEELRRVLRPGGILLISVEAPRAGRPARGGLSTGELERALRDLFANVGLRRQEAFLASAVLEAEGSPAVEVQPPGPGGRLGATAHVMAVACDGDLPELGGLAAAASPRALRRLRDAVLTWESRALNAEADSAASRNMANLAQMHQRDTVELLRDSQARAREELDALRAQGERTVSELDEARRELDEARAEHEALEQALAGARQGMADGAAQLEQLRRDVRERERMLAEAEEGLRELATQLEAREGSLSWRLTRPLRWAKRWALIARDALKLGGRS